MITFLKNIFRNTLIHKVYFVTKKQKTIKNLQTNGQRCFNEISNIFHENKIQFWLTYGTLLGYIRENNFIKHDSDIDLGINFDDLENCIQCLILKRDAIELEEFFLLYDNNNKLCGAQIRCIIYNISLDLYFFNISFNSMHTYTTIYSEKDKFALKFNFPFSGLERRMFFNIEVYIPKNPTEFLITHYGKDYLRPNPTWSFIRDTNNKEVCTDLHIYRFTNLQEGLNFIKK